MRDTGRVSARSRRRIGTDAKRGPMRRRLLLALGASAIVCPLSSLAQPAAKTLHIGILSSGSLDLRAGNEAALMQGLREQGYVEGKNLIVERRYVSTDFATRVPASARELAGMKLDAIVTTCSPTTIAAKRATSATPIVMAAVSDPVGQNIISSLAKPGQNVTGLSSQAEDLLAKRLELLTVMIPKPATVAVLANGLS